MSRDVAAANDQSSVPDKILSFLSGVWELNERAALGLFDPFKYEQHLYWRGVREENERKRAERRKVRQTLSVLERAGHVIHSGTKYRLTLSGWMKFASSYSRALRKLKKKAKKAKRKMIVVFDIPERERTSRNVLRNLLYSLGFSMFQRSVFIGSDPDSFEVVIKIVANAGYSDKVKFLIVDHVM